jgi:hypothetical protein
MTVVEGKRSAHCWYRSFPSKLKESLWLRELAGIHSLQRIWQIPNGTGSFKPGE